MLIARAAWVAVAVFSIGVWSLATVDAFREPRPSCLEVECNPVEMGAEDLELAEEAGFPTVLVTGSMPALTLAMNLAYISVAIFIFWRRSDDWIALLLALTLLVLGTVVFAPVNDVMLRTRPALTPATGLLQLSAFVAFSLLLYLFPDGRFVPRWTRFFAAPLIAVMVVSEIGRLFYEAISPLLFLMLGTGVYAQVYRYLRVSTPAQRQQTKWVLLGLTCAGAVMLSWVSVFILFPPESPSLSRTYALLAGTPIVFAIGALFPVFVTIAVLRYRLWDADVLINRTLVYGALTATIGATYFASVVLLQAAFRTVTDQGGSVAIVVSTLGIAALFQPLRRWLQGGRYNAERTLAAFSATARDEVDIERLSEALVAAVKETMQPAHASLWLREREEVRRHV